MGAVIGSVDHRRRPLVRVQPADGRDSFLAQLDTGFNGELFMAADHAARLGIRLFEGVTTVEVAGRVRQQVQRGIETINWLGGRSFCISGYSARGQPAR